MTILEGLIAAVHTPMRPDGRLNPDQIAPIVDHLVRDGVSGILVCGTTGEGPLLVAEERRETAARYVAAGRGKLEVLIHVGHASLREAELLAAHAQEIGADGVAAIAPYYFKPTGVEGLVDCMAAIAGAAPRIPFYYYHIPAMTGVALSMPEFLPLAEARIPNFAGIKFTSPAVHEFQGCHAIRAKTTRLYFGLDEMLLSGLAAGAIGAIGSTYNFAAPLYQQLWRAFKKGDLEEARACQARSIELIQVLVRCRFLPATKGVMKLLGMDCGPTRLPLVPLGGSELSALEQELRAIGFFSWGRGGPARERT